MSADENIQSYYLKVMQNLKSSGFTINRDVTFKSQAFDLVAKRKVFEVERFAIANTFYIFTRLPYHDINRLRMYSNMCFKYALKKGGIHTPRGIFYGVLCFPVAIIDSIGTDTVELIRRKAPPMHWSASEMLVAVSLESKELYYCETTPMWGSMYYDGMRRSIDYLLTP